MDQSSFSRCLKRAAEQQPPRPQGSPCTTHAQHSNPRAPPARLLAGYGKALRSQRAKNSMRSLLKMWFVKLHPQKFGLSSRSGVEPNNHLYRAPPDRSKACRLQSNSRAGLSVASEPCWLAADFSGSPGGTDSASRAPALTHRPGRCGRELKTTRAVTSHRLSPAAEISWPS